jgi:hypothetical protein
MFLNQTRAGGGSVGDTSSITLTILVLVDVPFRGEEHEYETRDDERSSGNLSVDRFCPGGARQKAG